MATFDGNCEEVLEDFRVIFLGFAGKPWDWGGVLGYLGSQAKKAHKGLIHKHFLSPFDNPGLSQGQTGFVLGQNGGRPKGNRTKKFMFMCLSLA